MQQSDTTPERRFIDWRDVNENGPWPRPGQRVVLPSGDSAVVDTAHGPKLTVFVEVAR